jgi:predicted HAD superfamily phosphohydrolase YqeG
VREFIGRTDMDRVWIVGDRLMTDIYLANRLGCRSVLVPPVERTTVGRHGVLVWLLRGVEDAYIQLNGWN